MGIFCSLFSSKLKNRYYVTGYRPSCSKKANNFIQRIKGVLQLNTDYPLDSHSSKSWINLIYPSGLENKQGLGMKTCNDASIF